MAEFNIAEPCASEVERYWEKWINSEKYSTEEEILETLFRKHPFNVNLKEVYHKTIVLNTIYSTNVYYLFAMAKYIVSVEDLDSMLKEGNLSAVDKVARSEEIEKNYYSFATKYCSFHNPKCFPMYDSYVIKMFLLYAEKYPRPNFSNIKSKNFKDYKEFVKIVDDFKAAYGLKAFSYNEIDKYLWQIGKEKAALEEAERSRYINEYVTQYASSALQDKKFKKIMKKLSQKNIAEEKIRAEIKKELQKYPYQ